MHSIRGVWRYLQYFSIDGCCLRQTPGLIVLQGGLDGPGDRPIHGVHHFRPNFPNRSATLLVLLATAAWAWIVTADPFHNGLLSPGGTGTAWPRHVPRDGRVVRKLSVRTIGGGPVTL